MHYFRLKFAEQYKSGNEKKVTEVDFAEKNSVLLLMAKRVRSGLKKEFPEFS